MDYTNDTTTLFHCEGNIDNYIKNLTSSYTDKSNESSVVATSVIMFVLAAIFFNLNLFSRVSDVSSVLNPTSRLVLSSSLSLFLPVMSYLFSEAKNAHAVEHGAAPGMRGSSSDLPLRARVILTWMLLVELLRKKVEAILVTAGMQGYSSIINQASSVAWLGNLVFFNLKKAGQKALYGILWLLCAAKLMQRAVITELGKRSYAYGKNARLLSSYMGQMLRAEREHVNAGQANGSERLKRCKYVVMGEEDLVLKPGPHGYHLDLHKVTADDTVVTVGKIWQLAAELHGDPLLKSDTRLKRLCLSFALFKLLRRRFEYLPAMTREETSDCRDLIFEGLCREEGVTDPEVALFQVMSEEVNFLCEYYHSVLPVVLASPYFFLVNYFFVPVVVFGLCAMTIVLCSNGNVHFALSTIWGDNYAISFGIIKLTKCLWKNVLSSPQAFYSIIDISISYILFLAVIYEEVWEFLVFVLSNWFMVSLVCTYTAKPRWRESPTISGVVRRVSWVTSKLSHPTLVTFKQFSVLKVCWLSMTLPSASLPRKAKSSIMQRFRSAAYGHGGNPAPLSTGRYALDGPHRQYTHLSWFCESDSVAEVILTWHIATSLLEMALPHKGGTSSRPDQHRSVVAMRLSKYCAYLVAFHPELLPDDREATERVYKDMKEDLKELLGCWGYYLFSDRARYKKMMTTTMNPTGKLRPECWDDAMTVVQKGIVLGKALMEENEEGHVWEMLADVWVELVVYVAPSGGDEHVKGHQEALVHRGELVTLLWALATHTGVTRPAPPTAVDVEDGIRTSS